MVLDDGKLRVELIDSDMKLHLSLVELQSGKTWGPAPLLEMETYEKASRRVDTVPAWTLKELVPCEGGFHALVEERNYKIEVGLFIRLVKGELSILLQPVEIVQRDAEMYELFALKILPGLLSVRDGKIDLPMSAGYELPTAGQPAAQDDFMIYGQKDRWELVPLLPFCAAEDADGNGMMILARQGATDVRCDIATDGQGGGHVGFTMKLKGFEPDPVDLGVREFRYCPVPKGEELFNFCGRRLREHIIKDLGKKTLLERAEESPEVAYLLDAYVIKLFHASKRLEDHRFELKSSFAQSSESLRKVKAAGIDKAVVFSVGWNADGHDGLYPTRFPIDERIGGESGFREMVRVGQELGFQMQVHDNYMMNCFASPDFNQDYAIMNIYGKPCLGSRWGGGLEAQAWPLSMPEELLERDMRRLKACGVNGLFYIDYAGQQLEINYNPKCRGTRADCAKGQARFVEAGKRVFGACGTELGFLPVTIAADHLSHCDFAFAFEGSRQKFPLYGLLKIGHSVPVWQIALSGLVICESITADWKGLMKCLQFGFNPRDEWCAPTDERLAREKAIYDIVCVKYGYLNRLEIKSCRITAPHAWETIYADGTVVHVDYAQETLAVNGEAVSRPDALRPECSLV